MAQIIHSIEQWRALRKSQAFHNKSTGFVPTMGNLHAGHASLMERAVRQNEISILSLFINPTQFNNKEDLKNYPRTLNADIEIAQNCQVDFIFIPTYEELYKDNYTYQVQENQLSRTLEGEHRPGHFAGVLTVVLKLLNLTQPTRAYFGEKDFQQLQLIQGMVDAFFLDIQIIPCPIIRDTDNLALSSRNSRLSAKERILAAEFPKQLQSKLRSPEIKQNLEGLGFAVDYIHEENNRRLGAVHLGNVRLIDNIQLGD